MDSEERFIEATSKKGSYEKYMLVVGVLGQFMFFFQAYHIFVNRSAKDVSFSGFLVGFVAASSWLIYGLQIKNRVVIVSNVIALIGIFLILLGTILYS
jgi:MtN3 and saliva related transmembrane protein